MGVASSEGTLSGRAGPYQLMANEANVTSCVSRFKSYTRGAPEKSGTRKSYRQAELCNHVMQ